MKYVYCLASGIEAVNGLPTGLGGAEVHRISFGKISALVSDIASDLLAGNNQNALTHQGVVQAALGISTSVIPCRFGTQFHDEGEILSLLKQHYALLEAKLVLLAGTVEVGVHAIFSEAPAKAIQPLDAEGLSEGAKYLLEKRRQHETAGQLSKKAEEFAQELNGATTPLWTDVRMQKRRIHQGLLLSLCYLVARENLCPFKAAYRLALQDSKSAWPGVKLVYTGSWPPYSFSDINLHHVRERDLRKNHAEADDRPHRAYP